MMRGRPNAWIRRFVGEHIGRVVVTGLAMAIFSTASLVFPWMVRSILEAGSGSSKIPLNPYGVICVFLIATLVGWWSHELLHELGLRFREELRKALIRALLGKPFAFFSAKPVGELSARAADSLSRVHTIFPAYYGPLFQNVLLISGGLSMMFWINGPATGAVLALLAVPLPFVARLSRLSQKKAYLAQSQHAEALAILDESLVAIADIRSFNLEDRIEQTYMELEANAVHHEKTVVRFQGLVNQGVYLVTSCLLVGIFWGGTEGSWFSEWSAASLIAFYMYAYIVAMAVVSSGRAYAGFRAIVGSLEHVLELIEGESKGSVANDRRGMLTGAVLVDDVTFGYDDVREVFQSYSLEIEPGGWYVITGPSGSGKSTLAAMLMGFHTPRSGFIRYDGHPLSTWDVRTLRSQLGYVGQRPMLFRGTVRDNIVLNRKIPDGRLQEVIRLARLEELVGNLSDGLETMIGERGSNVSGGQRLRLAIARAIVHHPAVLILDEPNSMLEKELEVSIWEGLNADRGGRTTVVFTHHTENIPMRYTCVALPSPSHLFEHN